MFWTFAAAAPALGGSVQIDGKRGHHLARVLRVRPGERGVAVFAGREYELEVVAVDGARIDARVLTDRPARGEPTTGVRLLQALLPNPDFDAVLEGGTAVGIQRFVAVQASRSVGRPPAGRLSRWEAIVESAAEQSHRGGIPAVSGPVTLSSALGEASDSRLLALDPTASLPLVQAIDASAAYTIAVGPEGGWTDDERSILRARGAISVNLGPRILRARLAPIVAAAILVQR
ncbi:MAG: rRNA (uracil1498-N3)-methyltransferase [Chloroflexota bacterium]|jgi:16S rRNA (uracil1498-N3)-methyltransferase|nr:rRNA (uracil1498-N3)-methyltransferase [Chloroflexota bacterium]